MASNSSSSINTPKNALVIGAGGGIATAIIQSLLDEYRVTGISRSVSSLTHQHYQHHQLAEHDETHIKALCSELDKPISLVVCCVGMLHDTELSVVPEKRLEDMSASKLAAYFHTNVIVPSLWLQHLPPLLARKQRSDLVFLSARVGSLSDNRLGGWYGYRSSKAALNMMIKTAQVEIKRRLPECHLSLYHPGTVDTPLSKPFQANVPSGKLFTPQFTAERLLHELAKRDIEQAPHYFDWNGQTIPW